MTKSLRGINLGGWLVVEYWMSPALFDGVTGRDEISLVRELGVNEAKKRLTVHRDTFITHSDFKWIRQHGFDFVRLPVGYWLFENTDDFIDGERYVDKAFKWAKEYGLGVVLDFHGLPGSQNGKDHSGVMGSVQAYSPRNRQQALETTLYMAKRYGWKNALLGLEIINEPHQRIFLGRLVRYYDEVIPQLRAVLPERVKIIVSDAFWPRRMARILGRRAYPGVVLDIHLYQNNPPVWRRRFEQLLAHVQRNWLPLIDYVSKHCDVMVGEWSAALPTSALDNAGNRRMGEARYFQEQQKLYATATWAHSYWNYKAPHNGPWDYVWARQWLEGPPT